MKAPSLKLQAPGKLQRQKAETLKRRHLTYMNFETFQLFRFSAFQLLGFYRGSLGTYGFLTPPYGLPYGLELKNNPRLCTSLRVYASNTPQEVKRRRIRHQAGWCLTWAQNVSEDGRWK